MIIWCYHWWISWMLTLHIWTSEWIWWGYQPNFPPPMPYYTLPLDPAPHFPYLTITPSQAVLEASPIIWGCWIIIIVPNAPHIVEPHLPMILFCIPNPKPPHEISLNYFGVLLVHHNNLILGVWLSSQVYIDIVFIVFVNTLAMSNLMVQ